MSFTKTFSPIFIAGNKNPCYFFCFCVSIYLYSGFYIAQQNTGRMTEHLLLDIILYILDLHERAEVTVPLYFTITPGTKRYKTTEVQRVH
jgi:hypothetical protein